MMEPPPWRDRYRGGGGRRDVFEVGIESNIAHDLYRLQMYSRMYEVQLAYEFSRRYTRTVDPRRVVEYAQRLIGTTLNGWYEAQVDPRAGREMAQALVPHWQRLIQHQMERFEYESARHDNRFYFSGINHPQSWGEAEDPKAKERARQLLMRNLDDGQLKSFKKDGWFNVTGADGVRYKVSTARSFNVEAEDGTAYCGQLTNTPVEDQMLAQKLLLQSDPKEFIKQSNVRPSAQATHAVFNPSVISEAALAHFRNPFA